MYNKVVNQLIYHSFKSVQRVKSSVPTYGKVLCETVFVKSRPWISRFKFHIPFSQLSQRVPSFGIEFFLILQKEENTCVGLHGVLGGCFRSFHVLPHFLAYLDSTCQYECVDASGMEFGARMKILRALEVKGFLVI